MSWSERRAVLLGLAALPVAGCFRPMLAEDSEAGALRGKISFPKIDGRFDYFLIRTLEDRLGKPEATDWRLDIKTVQQERGLAVAQDNSVTRITLQVTAYWSLWRNGATQPDISDKTITQSGYNATTSLFATRQTRRDIERRLARDIGERIARTILARSSSLQT